MSGPNPREEPPPSQPPSVDPNRLDSLTREAESLMESGDPAAIESALSRLDKEEREKYRQPLLVRLAKAFRTIDSDPGVSIDVDEARTMDRPLDQDSETIGVPPPPPRRRKHRRKGDEQQALPEAIGKFRIKGELGRGAFGVVYLGYDDELQRNVAIKVSLVSDSRLQERLRVEASKVAQVESSGIVPVYHIGRTDQGKVYIVQKYIEGQTLRDLITQGPLSPGRTARLVQELALGLEPAHLQDIIHRDLKPDNILLDNQGRAWIADFGLAISEEEQQGRRRELAGTPPYMSPEQIMRRVDFLDPRSDIWALGVMYYEMLCGKLPFSGKDVESLKEQICELDPRPLHQRSPDHLSEQMHEIFARCCAKNPADRFANVRELADATQDLIAGGLSNENIRGETMPSRIGLSTKEYETTRSHYRSLGRRSTTQADTQNASSRSSERSSHQSHVDHSISRTQTWATRALTLLGVIGVSLAGSVGYQMYSRSTDVPPHDPKSASETDPKTIAVSSLDKVRDEDTDPGVVSSASTLVGPNENVKTLADLPTEKMDPTKTASADLGQGARSATPDPEKPIGLGLDQADGSKGKPWVVSSDGTGSHTTIADAIAAGPADAHIRVTAGIYRESLKITSPITLFGDVAELPAADHNTSDTDHNTSDTDHITQAGSAELLCTIRNDEDSPIEIDCAVGAVSLRNLAIDGEGHRTTQEFNAINVLGGTLLIESCEIRTSSFNCIKVLQNASLGVRDCRFVDSREYAISAKEAGNVQVSRSVFIRSGIQIVGGTGKIDACQFFGVQGCYIAHSKSEVRIVDSMFESCQEQAIAVGPGGLARVSRASIVDCELGFSVQDGELHIENDTRIENCRAGIGVTTGQLHAIDVTMVDLDSGVVVTDDAKVDFERLTIERCQTTGIMLQAGTLTITDGSIEDCHTGIHIGDGNAPSDAAATATLKGLQIRRCSNYCVSVLSGPVQLTDLELSVSQIGLRVAGPPVATDAPENSAVEVTVRNIQILESKQLPVLARGNCLIRFLDQPAPLGSNAIEGATISEPQVE